MCHLQMGIVKANKEKQRGWREKNLTSWIFLTNPLDGVAL